MKNILYINACTRRLSRTDELAQSLIGKLNGEVCELKLYDEDIKALDEASLEKRDKLVREGAVFDAMFRYARQFKEADVIVISAPYWDLLFPAVLRTYLEAVSVCGITFRYSDKGIPEGLCKATKLYYITTAGGFIGENNFGFSYVKALSETLFGIKETVCFTAEGLDIYGTDVESIMSEAKRNIACYAEEKI